LKKSSKVDDAKKQMQAVLEMQQKLDVETVQAEMLNLRSLKKKQAAKDKENGRKEAETALS
jgi:hypothetical protein